MGCEQSTGKKSRSNSSAKVAPEKIEGIVSGLIGKSMESKVWANPELPSPLVASLLEEYVRSEKRIGQLENGDPLTLFYVKKSLLGSLHEKIADQKRKITSMLPLKDKSGRTLKEILIKMNDKKLSSEEQEIIAEANRLEIAYTELEMLNQEAVVVDKELGDLILNLSLLRDEYKKQDDILEKLNLNEEFEVHEKLEDLERERIRIYEIYERWREGRNFVSEACRQFSQSLEKWRMFSIDEKNSAQFESVEEIRDGLITALQCLSNAKFFIRAEFPYCTGLEIATLEKAMAYLFIDVKSENRRTHAENCYSAFHKRSAALFAWIDKSIEMVIEPDLRKVTLEINQKIKTVRKLRVNFIQEKFPNLEYKDDGFSEYLSGWSDNLSRTSSLDEEYKIPDETTKKIISELQLAQLAPLPSKYEVFNEGEEDKSLEKMRNRLRHSLIRQSRDSFDSAIDAILRDQKNDPYKQIIVD